MKSGFISIVLLVFISQLSFSQNIVHNIDSQKSEVKFRVSHLGVLNVDGVFQDFQGQITFKNDQLFSIEGRIHVKSVDTADEARDKVLVSEPYFNSEAYPSIRFESTSIEKPKAVIGQLTIKNETRLITLIIQDSEVKHQIRLMTKISRQDFKLSFGSMNGLIGDSVKIEVLIEY